MDSNVIIIVLVLIVVANAIKLNITDEWRPELGWEVTCSWEIPSNDSLQSVRLSYDGRQFMIYRPETHGTVKTDVFGNSERVMEADCAITEPGGQRGQCVLKVEPLQPPAHNFAVKCEVSGEGPFFIIAEDERLVKILVPPSNATLESITQREGSQASLNCSTYGLPAPNLLWTIEGDKHAQADFTGRVWNATSKLWHVWSFLSYAPADHPSTVTCTPVTNVDGESVKGVPAEFNSAKRYLDVKFLMSTAVLVVRLLR